MKKTTFVGLTSCLLLLSCSDDAVPDANNDTIDKEAFNFLMEGEQMESILTIDGQEVKITNPKPALVLNEESIDVSKFETRGETTLNFRRKSFNVNLKEKIGFYDNEGNQAFIDDFKLISLSMDYTYVNNRLAFKLYDRIGLWPLYTFFTEVALNDNTQGIYLFIHDPIDYFKNDVNSQFILRRSYHHQVKKHSRNKDATYGAQHYLSVFNSIYKVILEYNGEELYDQLSNHLDVEEYFRKIAIDYLLKNGDYTDELFFYLKEKEGKLVYGVLPWDYDDIFSSGPHEIGRDWAVGTLFGTRNYESQSDVFNDIGDKLIYSIEDDLDYKLAMDDYMYGIYITELSSVMTEIDEAFINQTFDETLKELLPFYQKDQIVDQSKYDLRETTETELLKNIEEKRVFLINRRNEILMELN